MQHARLLTLATILSLTSGTKGDLPIVPAWWMGNPPVIDPAAPPNNHGPANIGQAKWMAKRALQALRSVNSDLADQIEQDLIEEQPNPQDPQNPFPPILDFEVPPLPDDAWRQAQHAPLLTGQLKAIAHPFYVRLHAAAPVWLAVQRAANGTESGGIFPWTVDPSDNNHRGMANLGQLKAVFALHFTHDTDGDTLPDLAERIRGTNPALTMSFTGLPDAWLASYYTSVATFVPTQDDDSDGLTNFEEYLHSTNPLNPDTDGDGTWDGAEVSHGGNPNNPGDGGNPPSDPVEDVEFTVGGDYATWRMEIKATGPQDVRTFNLTSPQPGQNETQSFKLWKNNRYEITLHRTGGVDDWYCWEALTDEQPAAGTFSEAEGYYELGDRNDQAHFFTVAGHWLVDNRQGLFTSHLHSYGLDVASPLKAELIPVAIEDNIESAGVDIVSNSVAPEVAGYQDKLWIMAPIAGPSPPADYSNLMKFHIPLNPAADLEMECDHAEADPATVTLNNAKPETLWRGTGADETSDNVPDFKIGEHLDEVDLPIGVKTMKYRMVRVVVWPVNLGTSSGIFPDADRRNAFEANLKAELDRIFGFQINAWFDVSVGLNKTFDYLDGTSGGTPLTPYTLRFGDKEKSMINTYRDAGYDINVFLINNVLYSADSLDPWSSMKLGSSYPAGSPGTTGRENSVIVNMSAYYTNSTDQLHTIAHEIGHLLVGPGHPDQYLEGDSESGGPAPLPTLPGEHPKRLMHSSSATGKLLVKGEWDEAEKRLRENFESQ